MRKTVKIKKRERGTVGVISNPMVFSMLGRHAGQGLRLRAI